MFIKKALAGMSVNTPICEGTLLVSRYQVQAFLGEGTFGEVAKCVDTKTNREVAIKIIKDEPFNTEQALEEINILRQLQTLDPDECHLVRWNGMFVHKRLICLQFELLDLSLYDYVRQKPFRSLPIGEIRPILSQLNTSLLHLEALEIMHTDLKLDNVMIVDRRQRPLQIKLIDFGLAVKVSTADPRTIVQNLRYRAPEVMLGLTYSEPIDMWAMGVIAAELALGFQPFPGNHEYDMMKFIVDTLGMPPDCQLNHGQKTTLFFKRQVSNSQQTWRLKTPEEFAAQTGHYFTDSLRFKSLDSLEDMLYFKNKAEENAVQPFVDLLKKMLLVDRHGRIMPLNVRKHPFFSAEQQTDRGQNTNSKNLTVNLEEPNVTQQPSLQLKSVAFKATTLHEETVLPHPENVEDEEDEAAPAQPEVIVKTSKKRAGCVTRFFKRIRKVVFSWFHSDY